MTENDRDLLAAEFVLGTLDGESRRRVAQALDGDAALKSLVEGWERRLATLVDGVEPIEPPSSLWQSIEAAIAEDAQAIPGTRTIRSHQGEWRQLVEGVEMKLLFVDAEAGCHSYLMRLAPGAKLPGHGHRHIEECYVISGDMQIGPTRLQAGDYHLAQVGSEHPAVTSHGGGLIFVRSEIDEFAA